MAHWDGARKLPLSLREHQVCSLYAEGWTLPQVAEALNITMGNAQARLKDARAKYRNAGRPFRNKQELGERLVEDGHLED